jgi:translation initiation factor IF-2
VRLAASHSTSPPTKSSTNTKAKRKKITFIDTPGHAAFQAIRSRGASVADIAILVVAADDGVKAQTLEALQSIRDANIPFVVAINKIDKPNADLSRTQMSLLEHKVYLEQFGGEIPWAAISAKQGTGVPELLDLILLVAELHDFKADPKKNATGFVIEAHLDQKRGIAATLILRDGQLESGASVLAGTALSPVRIMENFAGKTLKVALPSQPVTLVGFDVLPVAGSEFATFANKKDAEKERNKRLDDQSHKNKLPWRQRRNICFPSLSAPTPSALWRQSRRRRPKSAMRRGAS